MYPKSQAILDQVLTESWKDLHESFQLSLKKTLDNSREKILPFTSLYRFLSRRGAGVDSLIYAIKVRAAGQGMVFKRFGLEQSITKGIFWSEYQFPRSWLEDR